jgi:hypothetical protein
MRATVKTASSFRVEHPDVHFESEALPLNAPYGVFTIVKYITWREGGADLYYEGVCEKCTARVTVAHTFRDRFCECPGCRFRSYLNSQSGSSDLKDKAMRRYLEHLKACTSLDVPPHDQPHFWGEIEQYPELGEPYPMSGEIQSNAWHSLLKHIMRQGER